MEFSIHPLRKKENAMRTIIRGKRVVILLIGAVIAAAFLLGRASGPAENNAIAAGGKPGSPGEAGRV